MYKYSTNSRRGTRYSNYKEQKRGMNKVELLEEVLEELECVDTLEEAKTVLEEMIEQEYRNQELDTSNWADPYAEDDPEGSDFFN